ncbi:MAG TPA: hypothetical protein VN416_08205, partial [Desulfomonilia bacterium]|nr:hypothetical protein [Desulfomonilia bacterium]
MFFSLNPARAEVSLITTGISSLVENKVSQAEKAAFDDALFKAYIETALKIVPGSSSKDLVLRLIGFVSARGTEDIIQYKIVSRSQIDNMLVLTMDIRMNDNPLREWLRSQSLTTPLSMRPRILLVITSRGPGLSERYEWWTTGMPKGYSTFEAQLAQRL